jgi:receptor protein-tyrosine kinase
VSSIEKAIGRLQKKNEKERSVKSPSSKSEDEILGVEKIATHPDVSDALDNTKDAHFKETTEVVDKLVDTHAAPVGEPSKNTQITLDYDNLNKLGFITPKYEIGNLEEEYRSIKRPILRNAFGKGAAPVPFGNLVMVTSALPGEGKSFTSLNLAMSMAMERDSTVLLIDGDVIRASVSKMLGVENSLGLTDLLEGKEGGVESVILSTDNPKLKIIPAGSRQTYSTELIASDMMGELAKELSSRYSDRIILFDAPPLLATTEAVVLTHIMGQIIVVVEAGKSIKDEVKAALSEIDDEKVVGLILNKSRKGGVGSYGGYYGGYGE